MEKLKELMYSMDLLDIKGRIIIDPHWDKNKYYLEIEEWNEWWIDKKEGLELLFDEVIKELDEEYDVIWRRELPTYQAIEAAIERDWAWDDVPGRNK